MYFCAIMAFGEAVLVPVADRDCLKAFSSEKIIAWAYFKLAAMLYEVWHSFLEQNQHSKV